jgi:ABC-type uncharacterized transport system permease subunit
MSSAVQALLVLLPFGYLVAAVFYGMAFAGKNQPRIARFRTLLLIAPLAVHLALFNLYWREAGTFPIVGTWLVISAVALVTALIFVGITWRSPQPSVACIVLLVVTMLQLLASAFGPIQAEIGRDVTSFRLLHSATSVVAAACLILSGTYGFMYILLYRQMRSKQFGPLFKELPSLDRLTRTTRRAALVGFVFLTVGLNVGIGMGHKLAEESFNYADPHVILTIVLWIHFGVIAFSRQIRGLSARRASIAAAAGLVTLLITLLLTLLPAVTSHSFQ